MEKLMEVLRHLVQFGPARDEAERDLLLGAVDAAHADLAPQAQAAPAPEPITVADQKAAGVPPEETVTVADQKAGAEVHPAAAEAAQSEGEQP